MQSDRRIFPISCNVVIDFVDLTLSSNTMYYRYVDTVLFYANVRGFTLSKKLFVFIIFVSRLAYATIPRNSAAIPNRVVRSSSLALTYIKFAFFGFDWRDRVIELSQWRCGVGWST